MTHRAEKECPRALRDLNLLRFGRIRHLRRSSRLQINDGAEWLPIRHAFLPHEG